MKPHLLSLYRNDLSLTCASDTGKTGKQVSRVQITYEAVKL